MKWIETLSQGLLLPSSGTLIKWNSPREDFKDSVNWTSDWACQEEKYGHAVWKDEALLPDQKVGILGLLRGDDLAIKQFECAYGEPFDAEDRNEQYANWKKELEEALGKPSETTSSGMKEFENQPTLIWNLNEVKITLEDYFTKDGHHCGIRIQQAQPVVVRQ